MITKIGGRKALMCFVVIAAGIGTALVQGDLPENLLMLLQVIVGAFVVGNGVEHIGSALARKGEVDAAGDQDLRRIEGAVAELKGQNEVIKQSLDLSQQALATLLDIAMGRRPPPNPTKSA